jgi:hypothetical protein
MIHTAPVFTPDGGAMPKIAAKGGRTPAARGATPNATSRVVEKEMQALEQAYMQAQQARTRVSRPHSRAAESDRVSSRARACFRYDSPQRIAHQKSNATRWIQRQSNRMQIQLEAVNQDRVVCSRFLDRECEELKAMEGKIERFCRWMASPQTASTGAALGAAPEHAAQAARPQTSGALPHARQARNPLPTLNH